LDEFRLKDSKYIQVRASLEEETKRRANADAECDRIRLQLS
jgi:hypothetical protein